MDAKCIILKTLAANEFGLKPTKGELVLKIVSHYHISEKEARGLLVDCLVNDLIEVNSVDRYSITQEGLDYLNKRKKIKDINYCTTIQRALRKYLIHQKPNLRKHLLVEPLSYFGLM